MHYIRFLKTPKLHIDRGISLLKAVVTVTTDLGETFYPYSLDLVVTIRAREDDGDIFMRKTFLWPGGRAMSLNLALDLTHQEIDWPACVHVAAKNSRPNGFLPPISDVWSASLNPVKGQLDAGHRVERRFMSIADRTLSLFEDAGDSIARHLWDGSQALAQHIDQTISLQNMNNIPLLEHVLISATYRRMNVIELGAGCGTVGISIAQSIPDCDVLLTDLDEAAELINANLDHMRPAVASNARFQALDWLKPLPKEIEDRRNDLVVVSECTYNSDTLEPLVGTLASLLVRSPKAVIVVSTKTRHESEAAFFDLMRKAGIMEDGSMQLVLPGEVGSGYADWASEVGIHVFRGKEHRPRLSPRSGSEETVP